MPFQAIQCYQDGVTELERGKDTQPKAKKPRKMPLNKSKLSREQAWIKTLARALNKNLGLCYRLLGKFLSSVRSRST